MLSIVNSKLLFLNIYTGAINQLKYTLLKVMVKMYFFVKLVYYPLCQKIRNFTSICDLCYFKVAY